jgi:transcriptional antiterminator Rof (Rho-off)
MKQIIERTEKVAYDYLKAFGFEEDKVDATVHKGITELENAFNKLTELINCNDLDIEEIDNVLHYMKGILLQLGNVEDGKFVDLLRNEKGSLESIKRIEEFMK